MPLQQSNADLAAESAAQAAALAPPKPALEPLAEHVLNCYRQAKEHRDLYVTPRLLACKRQCLGQYSPEKLALIRAAGGSETYLNASEVKSKGAESMLRDVMATAGRRPFRLEPTPVADLPEDVKAAIVGKVEQHFLGAGVGALPPPEVVREFSLALYDEAQQQLQEEAAERAKRMERVINDQLTEGGWDKAFTQFLHDECRYPLAIMKGPEFRRVKRMKWGPTGLGVVWEDVPTWRRVSPWDFFPAANARRIEDGPVCERVYYSKADLAGLRGGEGWSTEAIDALLASPPVNSLGATLLSETERATLEGRDTSKNGGQTGDILEGIQFWGFVEGSTLEKWNIPVEDPHQYTAIMAIVIGSWVIKAVANPNPLGRAPYYCTSYEEDPDSLWGRAIPEKMEDCQDAINAAGRSLLNNLAWASGPMAAVDIDAVPPGVSVEDFIKPRAIVQYSGKCLPATGARKAVEWWQPDGHMEECLKVAEYFENAADDRTQIPKYSYGNEETKGAGSTFRGLNLLNDNANRGIKTLLGANDYEVVAPAIEGIYIWNCLYHPERERIAGDCRIVTIGALELLDKQVADLARQNFLAQTNNPTDLQIIGIKGRRNLLEAVAQTLQMPAAEIVPSEEELMAQMEAQAQADMAAAGAQEEGEATKGAEGTKGGKKSGKEGEKKEKTEEKTEEKGPAGMPALPV